MYSDGGKNYSWKRAGFKRTLALTTSTFLSSSKKYLNKKDVDNYF